MHTRRQRTTVFGVAVLVAATGTLIAVPSSADNRVDVPPGVLVALARQDPRNGIAGLGVTSDAALRDDAIALWEAWQRDTRTQRCMRVAGFDWRPEVLYPGQPLLEVAAALEVTPAPLDANEAPPEAFNRQYSDALSATERDRYFQVLFGETASDVDESRNNGGRVPAARGRNRAFASAGCVGKALNEVGSVWDLKRSLADELLALPAQARKTADGAAAAARLAQCASDHGAEGVDSPAALDTLYETDFETARAVEDDCMPAWQEADIQVRNAQANGMIKRNQAAVDAHQAKYSGLLKRISADRSFLEFLGQASGLVEAGLAG